MWKACVGHLAVFPFLYFAGGERESAWCSWGGCLWKQAYFLNEKSQWAFTEPGNSQRLHSLGCTASGWHQGPEASEQTEDFRAGKGLQVVSPSTQMGVSGLIFLKMLWLELLLLFNVFLSLPALTLRTRLAVYWMNSSHKKLPFCSFHCALSGDILLLLKSFSESQLALLCAAISYLTLVSLSLTSVSAESPHPSQKVPPSLP